jgi:hypothetical protein
LPQAQREHRLMLDLLAANDLAGVTGVVVEHNRRMREFYRQAISNLQDNSQRTKVT